MCYSVIKYINACFNNSEIVSLKCIIKEDFDNSSKHYRNDIF